MSTNIELGDKLECIKPLELRHTFTHSPPIKEQVVNYQKGDEVVIQALIGYGGYFHISRSSYSISRDELNEHFKLIERRRFVKDVEETGGSGLLTINLNGHEIATIDQNTNQITTGSQELSFKEFEFINKIYQALQE